MSVCIYNKLHKILEDMNLDEYELIDLPLEQLDDSLQEWEWLPLWIQEVRRGWIALGS